MRSRLKRGAAGLLAAAARKFTTGILAAALPCLLLAAPLAAGSNLEEKVKYEKALEQKVEAVLENLLGPGKAKVMIQADIDFSARENVDTGEGGSGGADFKWRNINRPADAGGAELLPGFPVASRLNTSGEGVSGKYQREIVYPQSMIKRLTVSLVLSDLIPEDEANKVRQVIAELLGMDIKRGDDLQVLRARFAPAWYTSETFAALVRYGVLAVIGITGMAIVAFGFLRMAGALNNMAGAGAPQKISMEMNADGTVTAAASPELELLGGAAPKAGGGAAAALPALSQDSGGAPAQGPAEEIVFNIRPDKVPVLVKMLAKDAPADVALIALHLTPEMRSRFIALLPPDKSAEVVGSMSKVRFVSPDLIGRIKEELERRLSGAVGGIDKVFETVDMAPLKAKKALIENLEKTHPEVAVQLRSRVLFIEDIGKLPEKDMALLVSAVSLEQWTMAMWKVPESARPLLRAQMADRSWQMIEQTMKFTTPAADKIDAAVETVIGAAWKLIGEGRIANPNLAPQPEPQAVAAAPAPSVSNRGSGWGMPKAAPLTPPDTEPPAAQVPPPAGQ